MGDRALGTLYNSTRTTRELKFENIKTRFRARPQQCKNHVIPRRSDAATGEKNGRAAVHPRDVLYYYIMLYAEWKNTPKTTVGRAGSSYRVFYTTMRRSAHAVCVQHYRQAPHPSPRPPK